MKLEHQVTSLELSKKLKEMGVKKNSLFYWIIAYESDDKEQAEAILYYNSASYEHHHVHDNWFLTSWSALTVSELGEMLPSRISIDDFYKDMNLRTEKISNEYVVTYEANYFTSLDCDSYSNMRDKNLANAMAKMLIHLIENNLVKAEDLG